MLGYCLLLANPMVTDPTAWPEPVPPRQGADRGGAAAVTPAYRINSQILGHTDPWHAHVMLWFADEPDEYRLVPAWVLPQEQR